MSAATTSASGDCPAGLRSEVVAADAVVLRKLLPLMQLARKAGKAALGFEAAKRSLQHHHCRLLILAADIGTHQHRTLSYFPARCLILATKQILGEAFALNSLAVIAIEDVNFAEGILKIVNR
jgi:ribosomal protein L7Ae-like RNA K-turn-binding protein